MGYTLSLLLYGRGIAQKTGSWPMVSWSKNNELINFRGEPILMDDVRGMVAKIKADAEDLLCMRQDWWHICSCPLHTEEGSH